MKAGDKFKMQFKDGEIITVIVEKVFKNCVEVSPIEKAITFRKVSKKGKAFGFDCIKIDGDGAICPDCETRIGKSLKTSLNRK